MSATATKAEKKKSSSKVRLQPLGDPGGPGHREPERRPAGGLFLAARRRKNLRAGG